MDTNGHIPLCEDFVSFETAKLLKEKGFDEGCRQYWYKGNIVFSRSEIWNRELDNYEDEGWTAPTLQRAMKWLREVHNFYIDICPCVEEEYWNNKWNVYVSKLMKKYPFQQFIGVFNTYEDACEAAIRYCLQNLI